MRFVVNNDLDNIVFSKHNLFHFWFSFLLGVIFDFQTAYSVGVIYEGWDGTKKDCRIYKLKYYKYFMNLINWFRQNFLYSDRCSLQDLIIWDLMGSALGHIVGRILRLIFGV